MKRFIACVLVTVTFITNVFSLAGCGGNAEDTLQMGQWLMLVADAFGMVTYVEEKPYFPEVKKDDPSYAAFQMAAEWNILEPSEEIAATTRITWNDVLITLVNAGEFVGEETSNDEKIEFAINSFATNIEKSSGKEYVKLEEALTILDTAQRMWADMKYIEKIEEISFSEDAKNYLDNTEIDYTLEDDVITASADMFSDLKIGDVYVLPANDLNPASIYKVEDVQVVDGQVIITNGELSEEEIAEYLGDVEIQETAPLDFANVVGIYDENGNPIAFEQESSLVSSGMNQNGIMPVAMTLAHTGKYSGNNVQTGFFDDVKTSLNFKLKEGYSVSLSLSGSDISVELAKEDKKESRYREEKTKKYIKTTFENMELTKDVDYSWGVLHSATIKLDYKTVIEGGIKTSRTTNIGKPEDGDNDITKSLKSTISAYKNALKEFNKDVRDRHNDESIYICKLKIVDGWFASVDFIIKGEVSAEGELKVVVELEGAQGIQYKNGNLRYINEKAIDVNFAADANLEVMVGPGVRLAILDKVVVAEFVIKAGLGASVGMVAHLFDAEGHELYSADVTISGEDADALANEELYATKEDIKAFAEEMGGTWDTKNKADSIRLLKGVCLTWNLYPILRMELSDEGLITKVVKISFSKEILGKEDTFLKGHIDFPNSITNIIESDSFGKGLTAALGIGAECTYDYTPWDTLTEEETESSELGTENEELPVSDSIEISEISVVINVGESKVLEIVGIPDGYELKDIVAESTDEKIATFDLQTGTITGVRPGVAVLIIQTKDEEYKAYCAITVNENEEIQFEEIKDVKVV